MNTRSLFNEAAFCINIIFVTIFKNSQTKLLEIG